MKLFESIDAILTATRYLVWGIGLIGVPASAALALVNLPLGMPSFLIFASTLFLSAAIVFLLVPKRLSEGILGSPFRLVAGGIALLAAILIMGSVYYTLGGFPVLDLVFI